MLKAMPRVQDSNVGFRDIKEYDEFITNIAMKTGEHVYRESRQTA